MLPLLVQVQISEEVIKRECRHANAIFHLAGHIYRLLQSEDSILVHVLHALAIDLFVQFWDRIIAI